MLVIRAIISLKIIIKVKYLAGPLPLCLKILC